MSEEKIEVQKGSGNIFKDLEISNPEEYLEKAHLVFTIEDLITESGLRLRKVAKILNLSPAKLSTLLDGLLDDFSVDYLSSLITTLKKRLTPDPPIGAIDRFFQWFRQVSRSLFPNPLAVGTAGFVVLVLIVGGVYLGNRYSMPVLETQLSKLTPVSPPKVELTPVKGQGKVVRESSFGFGTFPKIPTDFPDQDIWNVIQKRSVHDPKGAKTLELLARVRIKLWEQGNHTKGVIMDPSSALIYPDSGIEILSSARADGDSGQSQYDMYFDDGLIPLSVKFQEGGVDPYEFLNLPR